MQIGFWQMQIGLTHLFQLFRLGRWDLPRGKFGFQGLDVSQFLSGRNAVKDFAQKHEFASKDKTKSRLQPRAIWFQKRFITLIILIDIIYNPSIHLLHSPHLRFLSFLEGSVAVGCWGAPRAGVPIGSCCGKIFSFQKSYFLDSLRFLLVWSHGGIPGKPGKPGKRGRGGKSAQAEQRGRTWCCCCCCCCCCWTSWPGTTWAPRSPSSSSYSSTWEGGELDLCLGLSSRLSSRLLISKDICTWYCYYGRRDDEGIYLEVGDVRHVRPIRSWAVAAV